ncbi:hypothetical protein NUW54_g5676 [Trametes sanguinea]|uniref:Uncharacterized protein n=1 Tax=Trametes sanguinea TaxID=158606 RepID=A0ACC1PUG7_9APHY|nr:hypothetical protein NUW54_g5676 [Trametes sanguinea]
MRNGCRCSTCQSTDHLMQMVEEFDNSLIFTKPIIHNYTNFGHLCIYSHISLPAAPYTFDEDSLATTYLPDQAVDSSKIADWVGTSPPPYLHLLTSQLYRPTLNRAASMERPYDEEAADDRGDADNTLVNISKKRKAHRMSGAAQPSCEKSKAQHPVDEQVAKPTVEQNNFDPSTNDLFELLMDVAPRILKLWTQERIHETLLRSLEHADRLMQMAERFNNLSFFTNAEVHDYANFGHSCIYRPDYLTPISGAFETYMIFPSQASAQLHALIGLGPLNENMDCSNPMMVEDSEPEHERIRAVVKGKGRMRGWSACYKF